ncbi:MAG: S8 family serine peptidase, partial [Gammaproteobacteria bacterium]
FNANPGLGDINADPAYAQGYFGQSVTVGVIDFGISVANGEFAGRIAPGRPGQNATANLINNHGTFVAGVIGAARDGRGIHGVAPSVWLMPLLSGGGDDEAVDSFMHAAEQNVQIVNNSYGFMFPYSGYDRSPTATMVFSGPMLSPLLDAHPGISSNVIAAARRRLAGFADAMGGKDMAAVWAAGNEKWQTGGQVTVFHISLNAGVASTLATVMHTPEYIVSNYVIEVARHGSDGGAFFPVTMRTGATFTANGTTYTISAFSASGVDAYAWGPRYHPQLLGRWLAVVAVDEERRIASFSNTCGGARGWCLAAPGVNIRGIGGGGATLTTASRTSFSAAHVSGALALLKSAFPQMSMSVIVQMLLQTADDLGEAGVDDIYGHGMVNVAAALQAQSNTRMLMANGAPLPLDKVQLPHAFADIGGRLGGVHSAVRYLDDRYYDAPVNVDIAAAPKLSPMRAVDNLWDDDGGGDINNGGIDIDNANFFVRHQGNGALRAAGGNYHQLQLRHHWFGDAPVWNANNGESGSRPFFFSAAGGRSSEVIWQFDDSAGIFAARGNEANGDYRQLGLRWQRQSGRLHFSSALSHIREDDTLLGGKFGGAMPLVNGGKTRMAEVSAKWQLHQSGTNKLHLFGNYQYADTDADIGGLASGISGLQARGWQAGITADGIFRGGDKLRFAFGEEMAIRSGQMHLNYARATNAELDTDTQLTVNRSWRPVHESMALSAPSRPMISAAYGMRFADNAKLSFGITRTLGKQTQAAFTYRLNF